MTDKSSPHSLAEKLDRLFRSVHPRGRGEYTYREVAQGIRQHGTTISPTYLWQLRTGLRTNPSMRHIEALAGFFRVPVAYFSRDGTDTRVDTELDFLAALRDTSVRHIALRANGLSPQSLAAITEIIEHVRGLEGLSGQPSPPSARAVTELSGEDASPS